VARQSRTAIFAAAAGNLAIAASKFAAFAFTGSSAMLTEAIHSVVDTGNQGLLLLGIARAARPPDARHPFGHGMELYFWSFVVALMIFALGGAFSIYEGLHKLADPQPIRDAWINFLVLGVAVCLEGTSFFVAWRENRRRGDGDVPLLQSVRRSKDPSLFAVLLEDAAALAGLAMAAAGVAAAAFLDFPAADGIASIGIGLLLTAVAAFMANETRSLLTGEAASPRVIAQVREILVSDRRVDEVAEILSLHFGPNDILLGVTLDFRDGLAAAEVEAAALELGRRIQEAVPDVRRLFLRPKAQALGEGAASPAG